MTKQVKSEQRQRHQIDISVDTVQVRAEMAVLDVALIIIYVDIHFH